MTTDFERIAELRAALEGLLGDYKGSWFAKHGGETNFEKLPRVIRARKALALLPPASSGAAIDPDGLETVCAKCGGSQAIHAMPEYECSGYDPAPVAAVADAEREDMRTHRALWRDLFLAEIRRSLVVSPDVDDKAFWRHELAVFDRVFSAPSAPDRNLAADAQKGGAK